MNYGESQYASEATRPMLLLTTRATINIGIWRVRTMLETGRTNQVATEMTRCKLVVLGISEKHWTRHGKC